jgi:hypothetical protein
MAAFAANVPAVHMKTIGRNSGPETHKGQRMTPLISSDVAVWLGVSDIAGVVNGVTKREELFFV